MDAEPVHTEDLNPAEFTSASALVHGDPDRLGGLPSSGGIAAERGGYQTSRSTRILGAVCTASIVPVIILAVVIALQQASSHKAAVKTLTVSLIEASKTPKSPPTKVETPQHPEKQVKPVQAQPIPRVQPPPILPITPLSLPAVVAPRPPVAPPIPAEVPTAAPKAPAPPSAPVKASHGPDRWEGRVLARLERFRHYPPEAQRLRVQGTALIRFRLDREGHVISASLERSSGNASLDQAAMETLRRADPLPKIPVDRPDQVELVVPIEFSIGR